jgi:membrane protein
MQPKAPVMNLTEKLKQYLKCTGKVLHATGRQMSDAQLFTVAGNLAYTTILSVIPLLAVSFSIFKAFGGLERAYAIAEPFVLMNLAPNASGQVIETLRHFIQNANAGTIGITGFIGLIFVSFSTLSTIESSINHVWRVHHRRKLLHRLAIYWLIMTLGPVALAIGVGVASSALIPLSKIVPSGFSLFVLTILLFFVLQKWAPHRHVHTGAALISATVTALLWNLAQFGYAIYTARVVTYNRIYGSLGAIPIILVWIYIIWLIVLSGAALTASIHKAYAEAK